VAAKLRQELGTEVEMVRGRYGEFKVFVGCRMVIDGGALAVLGILPSSRKIVERVRASLSC
jgi:hypothetical protein